MRIGVSHLKGAQRGKVETLAGPVVRVGSGADCDLRIDGADVADHHATLKLEGTDVHLHAEAPVRLNGKPVGEVVIQNYDLIEVGHASKIRVRLLPSGVELPAAPPFRRRRLPWIALAATLLLGLGLTVIHRQQDRNDGVSRRIDKEAAWATERHRASEKRIRDLREEMRSLGARMAHRHDVDQRVGEVQRAVAEVENNVLNRVTTEIERKLGNNPDLKAARNAVRAAERIIARHAGAVCLVQGAYGFGRTKNGKWQFLREVDNDLIGELDIDAEKVPLMLEGKGDLFQVEFTGTGFLVDKSGIVMTNRHIAEPWWRNDAARPLIKDGFAPRFLYLRLYFPGRKRGIQCDLKRTVVSDDADLAALRFKVQGGLPAPLTLADPAHVGVGREVILLGYPSGLNALMARAEIPFRDSDPLKILDQLARTNLVRPLPTRGHISDLVGKKVLFDAPTAVGGSGGPLLDLSGHVVAVNYGILKAFRGANFGVPVRHAHALLAKARR